MTTSNEDLIASDEIEERIPKLSKELTCPHWQKVFMCPRRLPFFHSFCHDCLKSHISDTASIIGSVKDFNCPLCGYVCRSREAIATGKLVLLFPLNTLILSVLMESKVKVDLVCNVCQAEDVTSPAKDMCVDYGDALCGSYSNIHKRSRLSRTHTILEIEELPRRQTTLLNNHAVFHCTEHAHNPVELFCIIHQTMLCVKCFFDSHNNCSKVVKQSKEMPYITDSLTQMKLRMQDLVDQVNMFAKINLSNLCKLETDVNELATEIWALKKTINDALDDLERRVKEKGNKIFNEEKKRTELLNRVYQSHITAMQNLNVVVESACKTASQSEMFRLTKIIMTQLSMCKRQIEDKYSKNSLIKFHLDIIPELKLITKIPVGEIGKLKMTRNDEPFIVIVESERPMECKAQLTNVKGVHVPGSMSPWFRSLAFTKDNRIYFSDYDNKACYLLSFTYDIISSYNFSEQPYDICVIGEKNVAISLPHERSVHILSIQYKSITPIRQIPTQFMCFGISAYKKDELIESGPCDDRKKYYWSIITLEGKKKFCHEFDGEGVCETHVALNEVKTRLYVSVFSDNSLHCFGLDGRNYFKFKHQELQRPQGVALDREAMCMC